MGIIGRVHIVKNPTAFFAPIVLGKAGPDLSSSVFTPYKGGGMVATLQVPPGFHVFSNVNPTDGGFQFPSMKPAPKRVSINLTVHGRPIYRSALFPFAPYSRRDKPLDIFLYQPSLPKNTGITAGQISSGLAGQGLPGNTTLKANPWGFSVAGSQSEADIQFGVKLVPDTSDNLSVYLGLELDGWNINVGWPAYWCESANDVLNSIKKGLSTAGSKANQLVSSVITSTLESLEKLDAAQAKKLLDAVSLQFIALDYPTSHSWSASDEGDQTVVVTPQIALGYPRKTFALPVQRPTTLGVARRGKVRITGNPFGKAKRAAPGVMKPVRLIRIPPRSRQTPRK